MILCIFVKFFYKIIFFCRLKFPGESTQIFLRPDERESMLAKQGFGYQGDGLDVSIIVIFSN